MEYRRQGARVHATILARLKMCSFQVIFQIASESAHEHRQFRRNVHTAAMHPKLFIPTLFRSGIDVFGMHQNILPGRYRQKKDRTIIE